MVCTPIPDRLTRLVDSGSSDHLVDDLIPTTSYEHHDTDGLGSTLAEVTSNDYKSLHIIPISKTAVQHGALQEDG